jgi:hypothetical protein
MLLLSKYAILFLLVCDILLVCRCSGAASVEKCNMLLVCEPKTAILFLLSSCSVPHLLSRICCFFQNMPNLLLLSKYAEFDASIEICCLFAERELVYRAVDASLFAECGLVCRVVGLFP